MNNEQSTFVFEAQGANFEGDTAGLGKGFICFSTRYSESDDVEYNRVL